MIDLDAYLSRVGLEHAPRADEEGLRALHEAQSLAIPFENFDVLLRRTIALDDAALEAKLLRRSRGGYCFELNGLMLAMLGQLGFDARPLLARVLYQRPADAPIGGRTHQISMVTIAGREWLTDVGFGGLTLRRPIPLTLDVRHEQDGDVYRLVEHALGTMLQARGEEGFRDLYVFTREPVLPIDLVMGNHYTATHPASAFAQGARAARIVPGGRITLSGDRLTRWDHGRAIETCTLGSSAAIERALRELGIDLAS